MKKISGLHTAWWWLCHFDRYINTPVWRMDESSRHNTIMIYL